MSTVSLPSTFCVSDPLCLVSEVQAKEKPPINVVGDVGGKIAIVVVSLICTAGIYSWPEFTISPRTNPHFSSSCDFVVLY